MKAMLLHPKIFICLHQSLCHCVSLFTHIAFTHMLLFACFAVVWLLLLLSFLVLVKP